MSINFCNDACTTHLSWQSANLIKKPVLLSKTCSRYRNEDSPVVKRPEVRESSPVKNSIFIVIREVQLAKKPMLL